MPDDLEELRAYSEKLRSYTTEELEDIYYRMHILKHPLHFRLLRMELESRGLVSLPPAAAPDLNRVRKWVTALPVLNRRPGLLASVLVFLSFGLGTLATFGMLLPVWVFAVPCKFLGIQAAIVYFVWGPIAPVFGIATGGKLGGNFWYHLVAAAGALLGVYLFSLTGTHSVIYQSIATPVGSGSGFSIGF